MLVNLVLRAAGKNLLFAPVRDRAERLATNEFLEGGFVGPLARDEIRGTVADIFPQR